MDQEHISIENTPEKPLQESVPEKLSSPESFSSPEKVEQQAEKKTEKVAEKEKKVNPKPAAPTNSVVDITNQQSREEEQKKQIDDVLSYGLADTFLAMTPKKQQEFKKAGEKTVEKINVLINKTVININKIVQLIRKWLNIIPNANKYYLEQEAKIKADKIIQIKQKH